MNNQDKSIFQIWQNIYIAETETKQHVVVCELHLFSFIQMMEWSEKKKDQLNGVRGF